MFKRLLIIAMAFSFCNHSMAYQLLDEEETRKQQTQIAAYLVEEAKKAFFDKTDECMELSKKATLLPVDFSNIELNEKELKTIILYFSAKTMKECVGEKEDKYLMAGMLARNFNVNDYSKKDDKQADRILARGTVFSISYIMYMPDYLAIDQNKRKEIEKIPKLKKVFNLDASIDALLKQ